MNHCMTPGSFRFAAQPVRQHGLDGPPLSVNHVRGARGWPVSSCLPAAEGDMDNGKRWTEPGNKPFLLWKPCAQLGAWTKDIKPRDTFARLVLRMVDGMRRQQCQRARCLWRNESQQSDMHDHCACPFAKSSLLQRFQIFIFGNLGNRCFVAARPDTHALQPQLVDRATFLQTKICPMNLMSHPSTKPKNRR